MTPEMKSRWGERLLTILLFALGSFITNAIILGHYEEKVDQTVAEVKEMKANIEKLQAQNTQEEVNAARADGKLDQIIQAQERIEQENIGLMKMFGARGSISKMYPQN